MKNMNKGIKLAFGTAIISGIANFVNKLALKGIQPLVHTTLKNSFVFLFITGICLLLSKAKEFKKLNKTDWIKLGLIGIIGGSLPFYLFFTALAQMPAINASLIHKTLIFWVALLAIPFLKEKLTPKHLIAIALLFSSNLIVGGFKGWQFSQPELMILAATLLWSVENVIAKVTLKKIDPMIVAGARMGFGSLILMFATEVTGKMPLVASLSLQQWSMILLTAVLLFGYVTTWYTALKYAPIVTVASILVSATLVTNILSAVFVTHALNAQQIWQALFVVAGTILIVRETKKTIQDSLPKTKKSLP